MWQTLYIIVAEYAMKCRIIHNSLLNLSLHGDTIHPITMCLSAEYELTKFS